MHLVHILFAVTAISIFAITVLGLAAMHVYVDSLDADVESGAGS